MKTLLIAVVAVVAVVVALGTASTLYAGLVRQVRPVDATVTVELVETSAVCGDQNDDGVVTVADVIIDLQIAVDLIC